jgi:hypothetical protein
MKSSERSANPRSPAAIMAVDTWYRSRGHTSAYGPSSGASSRSNPKAHGKLGDAMEAPGFALSSVAASTITDMS